MKWMRQLCKATLRMDLDRRHFAGMPPYGSMVARTILFHSLAFNESLTGIDERELRYATLGPGLDFSFIDDACRRFRLEAACLDERRGAPLRFSTEANLTQIIRNEAQQVDPNEIRTVLNDRIKAIFDDNRRPLQLVSFASAPGDVPDDASEKPYLVLIGYDADRRP